ncbi:MAG TPA: amidohydrolase family protein [Pseudomonadales bacterium]
MSARRVALLLGFSLLALTGCDKLSSLTGSEPAIAPADTIYTGTIVTMDGLQPAAEAVAVQDGRIIAVGTQADVMKHRAAVTKVRELGDAVMLPGFVDAHSYFMKAVADAGGDRSNAINTVQREYARNGYTTISNGTTSWQDYQSLQQAAQANQLLLDVIALADYADINQYTGNQVDLSGTTYDHRLRVGGVKVVVDGLPETKQAYLSLPLLLSDGPNGEKNWRGQPLYTEEALNSAVSAIVQQGAPVVAEAHGDSAIDMVLLALHRNGVGEEQDRRDVIIHSEFLRPGDQISQYKRAGVVPSFCTNRIYALGDAYAQTVGGRRANEVGPLKSAFYIKASNHTDYPETALNPMMTVWTAVNRLTESGKVLEEWQRVDVPTALRSITIDAAWQYHEDANKGSITVGKAADFVLLDENPLTADPAMLKDIQVLETIKDGNTVYRMDYTLAQ